MMTPTLKTAQHRDRDRDHDREPTRPTFADWPYYLAMTLIGVIGATVIVWWMSVCEPPSRSRDIGDVDVGAVCGRR